MHLRRSLRGAQRRSNLRKRVYLSGDCRVALLLAMTDARQSLGKLSAPTMSCRPSLLMTAKLETPGGNWLGREGSNLRMTESKSVALPLGDAPTRRRDRSRGPLSVKPEPSIPPASPPPQTHHPVRGRSSWRPLAPRPGWGTDPKQVGSGTAHAGQQAARAVAVSVSSTSPMAGASRQSRRFQVIAGGVQRGDQRRGVAPVRRRQTRRAGESRRPGRETPQASTPQRPD